MATSFCSFTRRSSRTSVSEHDFALSRNECSRSIPNVSQLVVVVSSSAEPWRKKMAKMYFSAHLSSVCRRRFRCITVAVPGVKSHVDDDPEG